MINRKTLLNAFRPGSAIDLPTQFAGRKDEVSALVDALHVDGSCPIIYGERGLGKSSLALQLERIALGDVELLEDLALAGRGLGEVDRFVVFQFSCTDGIGTKDDLLQRLINTAEGFTDAEALPGRSLVSEKSIKTLKLKVFEQQVAKTFKSGISGPRFKSLSVEEKFEIITRRVVEEKERRVLYIIDELDRVRDTKGLASVIKNLSSPQIKFLLVGVGQNVSALLHDHASLDRTLIQVHVRMMRDDDSAMIVRKAQSYLQHEKIDIEFTEGAILAIVQAAGGFPWFVHTLGQESLCLTFDSNGRQVNESHLLKAVNGLGKKRFGQQFYDTYQMAVRDSDQRETVLRLFAKWRPADIPTSDIYPIANELGVSNPSALTQQLTTQKYGRVLMRPPYAPTRAFRFTNAMFKQYVAIGPSLYSGVQQRVDEAWQKRGK
jgi:KAP-like P-loop domain-containing protein